MVVGRDVDLTFEGNRAMLWFAYAEVEAEDDSKSTLKVARMKGFSVSI